MEDIRILIVEDELIIAADIQRVLESLGFSVITAVSTGEEAIERAGALRPDLVLMDIILADKMDGVEAAKQINEKFGIPVVFLTGNADGETVRRARESQPYGYILKPIHVQDLYSTIDTALSRFRLEAALHHQSEELEAANEEMEATNEELNAALEELEATNQELIRSQETLLESERRLQAIIDNAPFGALIYELFPENRLVFSGANPATDRILKMDHRSLIGKTIEEAFPPLAQTEIPDAYRRAAAIGERYSSEQVEYDDGGISGAYEVHAFQTERNRMAVFFRDITERKRAEEQLCASEERYRELFEGIADSVFLHEALPDRPGKFLAVNDNACRTLGYSRDELLSMSVADIDVPEQAARIPAIMERLFRDGHALFETSHRTKDGRRIPVEVNVRLLDLQGAQVILSVARDIGERKRAQHYLDIAEVMMLALNETGAITLANRKCCAVLGYAEHELLGKNWFDACLPPSERDAVKDVFRKIMSGELESVEYYENTVVAASGEQRRIAWHNAIMRDEFGAPNGTLSSGEDITDRANP